MKDATPIARNLSTAERDLISSLLAADFNNAAELRQQATRATLRAEDYGGVLVLAFEFPQEVDPVNVGRRVPVEAEGLDLDRVPIHMLVHVVNGILQEVEIFREDSKPILRLPSTHDLSVQVNDA